MVFIPIVLLGIGVGARIYWLDTPDAAWRLILAVDRLLTPERRAL